LPRRANHFSAGTTFAPLPRPQRSFVVRPDAQIERLDVLFVDQIETHAYSSSLFITPIRAMYRSALTFCLLVLIAASGCGPTSPEEYNGTLIDPPLETDGFELTSEAETVTLADFEGKWTAVFFGYTNCPDICPATLQLMKRAVDQLEADQREQVEVAFVSIDPERDTPVRAAEYARAFDPGFIGLTGTPEQIETVARDYGIHYERAEGTDASGYLVDHTSAVLLLDPAGALRMIWSYGTTHNEIADDLRRLVG